MYTHFVGLTIFPVKITSLNFNIYLVIDYQDTILYYMCITIKIGPYFLQTTIFFWNTWNI